MWLELTRDGSKFCGQPPKHILLIAFDRILLPPLVFSKTSAQHRKFRCYFCSESTPHPGANRLAFHTLEIQLPPVSWKERPSQLPQPSTTPFLRLCFSSDQEAPRIRNHERVPLYVDQLEENECGFRNHQTKTLGIGLGKFAHACLILTLFRSDCMLWFRLGRPWREWARNPKQSNGDVSNWLGNLVHLLLVIANLCWV